MEEQDTTGSTAMFAVFLLSLYSLVLIPYTLHRLLGGGGDGGDEAPLRAQPPAGAARAASLPARAARRARAAATPRLLAAWAAYAALLAATRAAVRSGAGREHFDPYAILGLPPGASEGDVKRAYRAASLRYHPDKNPDPAAAAYFAESVTKAYKALADETGRANWAKYGHPDGPQATSIEVALPAWFFSKDKDAAPLILLSLLFGGIVAPLGAAACLFSRQARLTASGVMHDTLAVYTDAKVGVKPQQGLQRLPDTLMFAIDFYAMPFPKAQAPPLDALRRELVDLEPELKTHPTFWRRHHKFVKAHLLLLAHLHRLAVPPPLAADAAAVLAKVPLLLQELFGLSAAWRIRPNYGWLAPSAACVEMMQCVVQAVPLAAKRDGGPAPLLQLPGAGPEAPRRLAKRKVRTLAELQALAPAARAEALAAAGLGDADVAAAGAMLAAMPAARVLSARAFVEGADDLPPGEAREGDIVTVEARVALGREAHAARGYAYAPPRGGGAPRAHAPRFPTPREERWFFMVAAPAAGALLGHARVGLAEAEAAGAAAVAAAAAARRAKDAGAGDGDAPPLAGTAFDPSPEGAAAAAAAASALEAGGAYQEVSVQFYAPPPGKHELLLLVAPDCWVGLDRTVPLRLTVLPATRAEREGRAAPKPRAAGAAAAGSAAAKAAAAAAGDEGSDARGGGSDGEAERRAGSGSDSGGEGAGGSDDDDEDADDDSNDEYGEGSELETEDEAEAAAEGAAESKKDA